MIRRSAVAVAVTSRSRVAAVITRLGVARSVIHHSRVTHTPMHPRSLVAPVNPRVMRRSRMARSSLLGKCGRHEVWMGVQAHIESRKTHEQDEDHDTGNGEWHVMEKNAPSLVAARTQGRIRRSGDALCTHALQPGL